MSQWAGTPMHRRTNAQAIGQAITLGDENRSGAGGQELGIRTRGSGPGDQGPGAEIPDQRKSF